MERILSISVFCEDFDDAIKFYAEILDFSIKMDKYVSYGDQGFRRVILIHKIIKMFEIELVNPYDDNERAKIGVQGGTRTLFSIPVDDFEEKLNLLKKKLLLKNNSETPYGNFLMVQDPMGNIITIYEIFDGI